MYLRLETAKRSSIRGRTLLQHIRQFMAIKLNYLITSTLINILSDGGYETRTFHAQPIKAYHRTTV